MPALCVITSNYDLVANTGGIIVFVCILETCKLPGGRAQAVGKGNHMIYESGSGRDPYSWTLGEYPHNYLSERRGQITC